jgi:hypothetical protein
VTEDDPWAAARESTRAEVAAALAPRARRCPECGHVDAGSGRRCPRCGAEHIARRRRWRPSRRTALVGGLLAAIAVAALVPVVSQMRGDAGDHAARERTRQARLEEAERARLRAEVQPQRGRAARRRAGESALEHRAALVATAEELITRDARERVRQGRLKGPIAATRCDPYPLTEERRRLERDPATPVGRYECVAYNARFELPELQGRRRTGLLGHPYWVVIDYERAALVWCKISPRAGEGGRSLATVPVPEACRDPLR